MVFGTQVEPNSDISNWIPPTVALERYHVDAKRKTNLDGGAGSISLNHLWVCGSFAKGKPMKPSFTGL
jgi:hypothetical protein